MWRDLQGAVQRQLDLYIDFLALHYSTVIQHVRIQECSPHVFSNFSLAASITSFRHANPAVIDALLPKHGGAHPLQVRRRREHKVLGGRGRLLIVLLASITGHETKNG